MENWRRFLNFFSRFISDLRLLVGAEGLKEGKTTYKQSKARNRDGENLGKVYGKGKDR